MGTGIYLPSPTDPGGPLLTRLEDPPGPPSRHRWQRSQAKHHGEPEESHDDIFGTWDHVEEDFHQFVVILNKHHRTIKLKANLQKEKTEFLDTEVYFQNIEDGERKSGTKVFFKATDTHALLHNSFHPAEEATGILFKTLRSRGYSRSFLRAIKTKVQTNFADANGLMRIAKGE